MATYSKTTWATGDLITAEKMNKIETQLETTTPGATGSVRFDTSSSLTDAQKIQARTNIDVLSTTETNNRLAAAYNSATNYAIDDYCMYNNKIYRCIAAATNILPTNTAYWVEENTVSGALKSLNEEKADIDGYYTGLTAGNAEQLVSSVKEKDTTPYVFRTSGGDVDIGNRREISLTGGSIAWNQLIQSLATTGTYNGVTFTKNLNGSWTLTGTTTSNNAFLNLDFVSSPATNRYQSNHVYYLPKGNTSSKKVGVCIQGSADANSSAAYSFNSCEGDVIIKMSSTAGSLGLGWARIQINEESNVNIGTVVIWPQIFDLTQMFGTTIADYVYGLEQAEAGAGVAWFKKLFPKDYYAYDAGTLMSVNAARAETVGFNMWDEEYRLGYWNQNGTFNSNTLGYMSSKNVIPVFPDTEYAFRVSETNKTLYVLYLDANKNNIERVTRGTAGSNYITFTTPSNCHYIRFSTESFYGTTYNNDICINLSWSGYRNGEYEPYVKNTYNFDSALELRGIPKLDSDGKLYYDGDEYTSDGTVKRKYGIVDLGTLTWDTAPSYGDHIFRSSTVPCREDSINGIIASKYKIMPTFANSIATNNSYCLVASSVRLRDDSYSDASTLKTALSGVYLVYELDTPTEETADPYVNPQIVDDFGTEEFVDAAVEAGDRDVSVPVGHNSQYMANLRDKLQHLPDLASGNGTYVITQANSQMTLTPLTTPTELPAAPTTNGTYKLHCVVSSGTATYSWVADS